MSDRGAARAALLCVLCLTISRSLPAEEAPEEQVPEGRVAAETTAEEQESTPVFTGEIDVTRAPVVDQQRIDRNAVLVTSVSRSQVEDLAAQDLSSALRRVPGVVVSRYNLIGAFGGGDGGAVFLRGHGSGRPGGEIATLVDGVPRFVGVWTHPLLDALSLDTVDRIDIYRSAQPVLLGNMAFGAVDMRSRQWGEHDGAGGRVSLAAGEHETLLGQAEYGGRAGRLDWFLTASHRESDGHRERSGGEIEAVSGRLGWELAERWQVALQLHHTDGRAEDPGQEGAPAPPVVPLYETDADLVLATLSHDHGPWRGSVKLYLEDGFADWLQWDDGSAESFRSVTDWRNHGVRIRETTAPWPGGELVTGFDHDVYGGEFVERHAADDRLVTDLEFRSSAPYLMVSHSFGGEVQVIPSAGVRYTDTRFFGSEWSGQAGVRVAVGGTTFYANAAHAFNLPGVWAAVQYGGWGRGDQWRQLEAETVDHLELGVVAQLGEHTSLRVGVFEDDVEDALRFVPPPPPPPAFANVGAYTTRGVEASVQLEPVRRLRLFLGATAGETEPEDVPNAPDVTAVSGVTYAWGDGWRASVDAEWVDERYVLNPRFAASQALVPSYLLVNGRFAAPLPLEGLGLAGEVSLAVENLGDESYEHRLGYPMPGRTAILGAEVRF